jgi:peroxiredoxin Q/BCP
MTRRRLMQFRLSVVMGLLAGAGAVSVARAQDPAVGKTAAILVSGPREGDRAPDFSLPWASRDTAGAVPWFSLSAERGKVVVVAFYPRDFTSGCTAEMKAFTEQYTDLFGDDVVVVGISTDSLSTHQRFAASLGLPFRLLSDPDQRVSKVYGSADTDGRNRRTVFVVDRKGRVGYVDYRFGALDPESYSSLKSAVQEERRR